MKPIVAVVGRPNVGKSTLFNRLVQKRIAIIEDIPGITRDRIYADAEWSGREFTLVDTGGIQEGEEGTIEYQVRRQAEIAMREADLILFVVDARDGLTSTDREVADLLRRVGKSTLLVANKADNLRLGEQSFDFFELGLGQPLAISSIHGMGTGDLLDEIIDRLPVSEEKGEEEDLIKVAVIGRPNVGKSSLVNSILGEERLVVSDVAGTTRDAIDVLVRSEDDKYLFIDTAGMRRRGKIDKPVEKYSVIRALRAVDRSDVVLMLIDSTDGVTEQDQKIAGYANEAGKACVIVVNKWDLIEKDDKTMQRFTEEVRRELIFLDYAPVAFVSAKTRSRVHRLIPLIKQVAASRARRIPTGALNDLISETVALTPPPADKGKRLKILYVTQPSAKPPLFVFFVNEPELVHFSYRRHLENKIREAYGFEGTPIRLVMRRRE